MRYFWLLIRDLETLDLLNHGEDIGWGANYDFFFRVENFW